MIKTEELRREDSCINKAFPDEMVFVLLARDAAAADTIRFWARRRVELGKNSNTDPQIIEAYHAADVMDAQRKSRADMGGEVRPV